MITRIRADLALDARATIGEGPLWDSVHQRLDFVDILEGSLHHYYPSGSSTVERIGKHVGAFARRTKGGYVLAVQDGFALLDDGGFLEPLAPVEAADAGTRMNDGKCDSRGRFWAGTMAYDVHPGGGALYRLDADGSVHRMLDSVTISNGLAWTADDRHMFYVDSLAGGVDVFDFDVETGAITNAQRAFDIRNDPSSTLGFTLPDGVTIDAEDHLWVAVYGAGEVRRYSSSGVLEMTVDVPVLAVTSCTFGGEHLDELYITTAAEHSQDPLAGGLFCCRPGFKGTPARTYAG